MKIIPPYLRIYQQILKDLENAGFEVIELPLIEEEVLSVEVPTLNFDFVVFQSPRAVRVFLSRHGPYLHTPHNSPQAP